MILHGDLRDVLPGLDAESVHACVTDPPYELGFMGKAWDRSGIAFQPETWAAVFRVLKPGGHLLAFGGSRTAHRIAVAIEDAGFEVRDTICWLYGSGFPKSHNIGDGWGTALKPAYEPVIVARKPFRGTVAQNVAAHGTGALNVDGCRIGTDTVKTNSTAFMAYGGENARPWHEGHSPTTTEHVGRWPANVCLDEDAAALLDAMSGERAVSGSARNGRPATRGGYDATKVVYGDGLGRNQGTLHNDTGGASRFFYCAKASRRERNAGLAGLPEREHRPLGLSNWDGQTNGSGETMGPSAPQRNHHPTVKPIALMRWLVRLVTPPGGTVLDPFAGSGTTGIACALEGFDFLGVEREAEYVEIAERRIAHHADAVRAMPLPLEGVA